MKKGSLFGATLLLGGSCLGAGMLALPIETGYAGFLPSLSMFLLAWLFMTANGLLLIEVNGYFKRDVNIVSMAGHGLGKGGKALSWVLYLFLFYALLVAYISGSGSLLSTFFAWSLNLHVPPFAGSLFFVLLFGLIVLMGTRKVDVSNRYLMIGKIGCYLAMVLAGVKYVESENLLRSNSIYAFASLPVLVIAFGFHNMIPSITSYLGGDLKRVRKAVIYGSLFALGVYLLWEVIALGIIPLEGPNGVLDSASKGYQAAQSISGLVQNSGVAFFAQGLAFFAILTSFLAQSMALVHFLADGLDVKKEKRESVGLCALALVPPLLVGLKYPQLFISALNFAGGICAVILFGLMPALIVWMSRYKKQSISSYKVPGGKVLLIIVMTISVFIFVFQLASMLKLPLFPTP